MTILEAESSIHNRCKTENTLKDIYYHQLKAPVMTLTPSTMMTVAIQNPTIILGSIFRALSSSESK